MMSNARRRQSSRFGLVVVTLVAAALHGDAQTALRLRGQVEAAAGGRVPASIELEAVYGFRGLEFVGQKTFSARSNDKGQWSVLGVTSGAWIFAAHAPLHLPQVVLLPVQFTQKNPLSAAGGQIPWEVGFELTPKDKFPVLGPAVEAAMAGRRADVAPALAAVAETGDAATLVAAGEIALYARDPGMARALFERALVVSPAESRAQLGLASVAMMAGDWDRASKAFWTARQQGVSPKLSRAVGAAITELQRIARPPDGPAQGAAASGR